MSETLSAFKLPLKIGRKYPQDVEDESGKLVCCAPANQAAEIVQAVNSLPNYQEAVSALRVLNEETILSGFPGGDRTQTLANVRTMGKLLQEAEKALIAQGLRDNQLPNPFGHNCHWCSNCCDRVEAMRANVLSDLSRLRAARDQQPKRSKS